MLQRYFFAGLLLLSLGGCKVDPFVITAKAYKDPTFTGYFRRTTGWVAGDGAYSVPLINDNSLWFFGDSYLNSYDPPTQTVPCLFQVHNACLEMGISNPTQQLTLPGTDGTNTYLAFGNSSTSYLWPGPGYEYGDSIYEFVSKQVYNGTAPDSTYIAIINANYFDSISYYGFPAVAGINFASSVIQDSSGYVYAYGLRSNGFGNDLFVARYAPNAITAPWQFYGRNGWSTDTTQITKIWSEFTASFNVCKVNGQYVLITTEFSVGCDQGRNIYVSTGANPYGPFSGHHSVWQVNDTLSGHYPFFYLANAHPEYNDGNNDLLITYCINNYGDCVNTCINGRMNPDYYRPKAIRVPYAAINPGL